MPPSLAAARIDVIYPEKCGDERDNPTARSPGSAPGFSSQATVEEGGRSLVGCTNINGAVLVLFSSASSIVTPRGGSRELMIGIEVGLIPPYAFFIPSVDRRFCGRTERHSKINPHGGCTPRRMHWQQ